MAKENTSTLLTESLCSAVPMLIASLFSIAFYGVIELTLRIIMTFKRRRGLYFWSLIIATWGIAFSTTGSVLDFGRIPLSIWIIATISLIGWICMVSGQAVVLYSRLHLVLDSATGNRAVLILIITNAVVWHTLIGVLYLGSQSSQPSRFLHLYNILEKVQLSVFALQEILISNLYIYSAAKFVGLNDVRGGGAQHKTMKELVIINAILIVLDIVVVSLQYANLYDIQISFKVAAYSIKLRLEFDILNRLVRDSRRRNGNLTSVSEFGEDRRGLRRSSV